MKFNSSIIEVCSHGPNNNFPALVQIMACHLVGAKPLFKPMIIALLTALMSLAQCWIHHDVTKWKLFHVSGHLCGEFPTQRPLTLNFDVSFDLRLNKWLSKQSWDWWLEMLSCPLWHHCNECTAMEKIRLWTHKRQPIPNCEREGE